MDLIISVRENVTLHILKESDAEMLFNTVQENKEYLREWLGWVDDDKTIEDTKKYIKGSIERFEKKEGVDFQIWEDEKMIGGIGLYPIDTAHKKTSLGYWLSEDSQGKGIMTDAVKKVIEYAFTELGLNRIEVSCAVGNTKSSAIPKKLGFVFEGISRDGNWLYDHFVDLENYSLLKKDWGGN